MQCQISACGLLMQDQYDVQDRKKTQFGQKSAADPRINSCRRENRLYYASLHHCGPYSVVGVASRHGPQGVEIETRWAQDIPRLPRPALGLTQRHEQCVPGFFPGG
jgi:hypothetical protein